MKDWLRFIRIQQVYEKRYRPQVLRVLKSQAQEFIDKYKETGRADTLSLWNPDLLTVFAKMYRDVVIRFAKETYRQGKNVKDGMMGFNAKWTDEVNQWIAVHGLRLVSTISGNTMDVMLDIINEELQQGVNDGLGVDEVTRNILKALEGYRDSMSLSFRADRIVRTETIRGANMGHMKGADELPYYVTKKWVSAHDHRVRQFSHKDNFDHLALDQQTRELGEPFMQIGRNGQIAIAQQPGDETAPASFTINCRCTVTFKAKRDSNGKILMKKGHGISV